MPQQPGQAKTKGEAKRQVQSKTVTHNYPKQELELLRGIPVPTSKTAPQEQSKTVSQDQSKQEVQALQGIREPTSSMDIDITHDVHGQFNPSLNKTYQTPPGMMAGIEIGGASRDINIHRRNLIYGEDSHLSTSICGRMWYWFEENTRFWIKLSLSVIAIVMISSMVPASYYGVEYHEYAMARYKLVNSLDYSKVYDNGFYFLGLNYEMIKFPRVFTHEHFTGDDLRVFSKEGLEFAFQCSFQWRPIKEFIPSIHKQFRLSYQPQVKNRVIATIKNTVTMYTTDDFIHHRALIDKTITKNIGDAVRELGFDIPEDKFQFEKPLLPDNVRARFLQTQVQLVKNDEQVLRQQQALVIQETNVLVGNINSNATRVLTQATSTSTRIIAEANANAYNIYNTAEQQGLYELFSGMNITDSYTKALLRKIMAIENNNGVKLYYNSDHTNTVNI